jgi:hypothetical protein
LNDIGRNSLLGNRKKIAKFLMRTFTCRSTFLFVIFLSTLPRYPLPSQHGPKNLPILLPSVVDKHCFDAYQDPNFHLDADPDPDLNCHQHDADPYDFFTFKS